ncbi:MAG: exodeoxyribonuclease VII small subunit [Firmicutes bacterium]|nr:exodeoxyribonuclease VII small subunit [Bacillota bacterium]
MAKKKSFEESFEKLETAAAALRDESGSLEDSIRHFEDASKYYKECREILENARQRMLVLDKETGEVTEEVE